MKITLESGGAAKRLGVTFKPLQRWEYEGRLVPSARTASNRRHYTEDQLSDFLKMSCMPSQPRRLVLAHRNRLTRFGFDWLAH